MRKIVDVHRDHWINLQNIGMIRGDNVPIRRALSLIATNLAACLARITVASQLSIANKAFVELVRRAPVI